MKKEIKDYTIDELVLVIESSEDYQPFFVDSCQSELQSREIDDSEVKSAAIQILRNKIKGDLYQGKYLHGQNLENYTSRFLETSILVDILEDEVSEFHGRQSTFNDRLPSA